MTAAHEEQEQRDTNTQDHGRRHHLRNLKGSGVAYIV